MDEQSLLRFPCRYPIKVMSRSHTGLRAALDPIFERHAGASALAEVTERPSAQSNFVSVTYIIHAQSAEQIAALFADLRGCEHVLLVL